MQLRRSRFVIERTYRVAVYPALAALLSIVAGCGRPSTPDDTEARTVIERFLEQVRTGEVDAAWESTTADFKSDEGRDAFRRFVRKSPLLGQKLEFTTLEQVEVNGLTRWEAALRPTAPTKDVQGTVKAMIAEENAVWKVERLTIENPA